MSSSLRQLLILAAAGALLWGSTTSHAAPAAQSTPTPTATPTAIPTVVLALDQVIGTSGQLATTQTDAWQPERTTGPFLLSLTVLSLLCGLLKLIKGMIVWRASDD